MQSSHSIRKYDFRKQYMWNLIYFMRTGLLRSFLVKWYFVVNFSHEMWTMHYTLFVNKKIRIVETCFLPFNPEPYFKKWVILHRFHQKLTIRRQIKCSIYKNETTVYSCFFHYLKIHEYITRVSMTWFITKIVPNGSSLSRLQKVPNDAFIIFTKQKFRPDSFLFVLDLISKIYFLKYL